MPLRAVENSGTAERALSHEDMRAFTHALTSARGQFTHATKALCVEFSLGPRGPWIIGMIGRGPIAPHELAEFYKVGRSLITAELNKLADAGLIVQGRDKTDGRRATLSLTPAGRKVFNRLGDDLDAFLSDRLSGYSRDDIMLCAQILNDFARGGRMT
ncbi:MarR family winged helix-turn-helix transcriptional regulator [Sphingomonas sp. SUN039]|uniref:MarR family winged helix-turn-helix transcriptional regulator n=1 Tax=Sphingomonas sp. SUN039 TaxID=2937787 RepID=UPI0021646916|nr:MarR family transcriptional regulator [Sphingomonas sp. SUN039]UVO52646.1 winged helix DNA-binding protein [Sphingomonas sp. SUN039]